MSECPELLSPAGDWEALRAAVANGADAVYFGLEEFNARHRARNFALEELGRVCDYLRRHNVRGYLALNSLIFSEELGQAARIIEAAARAGVDGVIVQDLGLVRLIRRMVPSLLIHGSTQMTLTEARGMEFVRRLGVQRVILARELSLQQIGQVTRQIDLPVEVFVHGSLCISYSGQCLTSESLGGRSANRGRCAQACRLPYELVIDGRRRNLDDGAYLLSPKDLAAYERIGELVRLGVSAFKIEGRLKSAHYVAAATRAYRAALDAAMRGQTVELSEQQRRDLTQSFSRGFSHGFLDGPDHRSLVHARFPKARGLRVGTVIGTGKGGLRVRLETGLCSGGQVLRPGDGIVVDEGHPDQDEQGGRVLAVEPLRRGELYIRLHRREVNLAAVAVGAIVWKTDDPAMRRRLASSYAREQVFRRVPVDFEIRAGQGGTLEILAQDSQGHQARAEWPGPLQKADRHPLTDLLLRQQLGRLGATPFRLGSLRVSEEVRRAMVPKSVLNSLRRQVIGRLLEERAADVGHVVVNDRSLQELRREIEGKWADPQARGFGADGLVLTVLVRTQEQLTSALEWCGPDGRRVGLVYCEFDDVRRYSQAVSLARRCGIRIGLATLRIFKPGEDGLLRQMGQCVPDCILVRNLGAISFFREEFAGVDLVGDYSLNVANELTAAILMEAGLSRVVPGYDLNFSQLRAMLRRFPAGLVEVVLHQQMPLFHMEHCVFAHVLSGGRDYRDCGRPCQRHRVELRDRMGVEHPLLADAGCRNTLYNGRAQSAAQFVPEMVRLGVRYYRVELLRQNALQTRQLLTCYASVLAGRQAAGDALRRLRVLSHLGVTPGTFRYA